jgi:hypothetical protein
VQRLPTTSAAVNELLAQGVPRAGSPPATLRCNGKLSGRAIESPGITKADIVETSLASIAGGEHCAQKQRDQCQPSLYEKGEAEAGGIAPRRQHARLACAALLLFGYAGLRLFVGTAMQAVGSKRKSVQSAVSFFYV